VKYKGRNQKEPVFIDGKEAGSTPFKELVPVCTERVELGKDREWISPGKLRQGGVEHTRNMPTWKSTLLSLAIGTVSGVLLYNAYSQYSKSDEYVDKYNELKTGYPYDYRIREKAKDASGKASVFLISGGVLAVSAVGVYLWF